MMTTQLALFPPPRLGNKIVNVASVPQRSPFRYPGGKTWLVPHLRRWFSCLPTRPQEFIEPFAGGAIASLTVAAEGLADHVTMVELDENVAAVWQTILDDGPWLAQRISAFHMTAVNVASALEQPALNVPERAFQTILRNRINRGGILAPGAGRVRAGEAGKGLASRWYPATLARRILDIVAWRERITFIHGEGLDVLRQNAWRADTAFFLDPPYTAGGKRAGSRLYLHAELDHHELFAIAATLKGDFLMTYDDTSEVRALAQEYGFNVNAVPMKNTHHAEMMELLIGRDLAWTR